MRKQSISVITFAITLVFVLFVLAAICEAQKQGEAQTDAKSAYNIPEEKKQQWESMKNLVEKEYNVCVEHCGNDKSCLDRCEAVYKIRLERERQRISGR
jgi:hypothetical protein